MKYSVSDYKLNFQAKGLNSLAADFVSQFLCQFEPGDSFEWLTISSDNVWKHYMSNKEVEASYEKYKVLYSSKNHLLSMCKIMEKAVEELNEFKEKIKKTEVLTREDFDLFVALFGKFWMKYGIFEPVYTDYLFKDERKESKELIKQVELHKNTFRVIVNDLILDSNGFLSLLVKKISKQTGIPEKELKYSNIEKIQKLLSEKYWQSSGEDGDDYVQVRDGKSFEYYFGKDAKKFIADFYKEKNLSSESIEIKGISAAAKRKLRGRVRKAIMDYTNLKKSIEEINNIEEGIILVSDTTTPEMSMIIAKSAAVVTDIGGMLSHAAIICRELNKPCIIGTKIATQVLKDGDLVEVDANKGVVKILKKKK